MDYTTKQPDNLLRKYQWYVIHNPRLSLFGGSEEETSEGKAFVKDEDAIWVYKIYSITVSKSIKKSIMKFLQTKDKFYLQEFFNKSLWVDNNKFTNTQKDYLERLKNEEPEYWKKEIWKHEPLYFRIPSNNEIATFTTNKNPKQKAYIIYFTNKSNDGKRLRIERLQMGSAKWTKSKYYEFLANLLSGNFNKCKADIKNVLIEDVKEMISSSASIMRDYNNKSSNNGNINVEVKRYNYYLDNFIRPMAKSKTNFNKRTMTFNDLLYIWHFELNENSNQDKTEFKFGVDDYTTKYFIKHIDFKNARKKAIEQAKLAFSKGETSGNLYQIDSKTGNRRNCVYSEYHFEDILPTIVEKDAFMLTVGSYMIEIFYKIDLQKKCANFKYVLSNTTGWESGTRFIIKKPWEIQNQPIIPNKKRGEGIHLGGTIKQKWVFSELQVPLK